MRAHTVFAALLGLATLTSTSWGADSPELTLQPSFVLVNPGDEFFVNVTVPVTGKEFNGFELKIWFPPTRVEFVAGSQQVGALVTSSCSNRFQRFTPHVDHLEVAVSLLCANQFMAGPGVLYRVKFRALPTAGPTGLFLTSQLFKAGFALPVGSNEGSSICVSNCVTEVGGTLGAERLEFSAPSPNPRRGNSMGTLRFRLPESDAVSAELLDVRGRVVARRDAEEMSAGPHEFSWALPQLAPGLYHARVRTSRGLVATRSWVILR